MGKCGYSVTDGSPLGESYSCFLDNAAPTLNTSFTPVTSNEYLLPRGSYSWWGIWPPNEGNSVYGSHMFTADFPMMLENYHLAHSGEPELYFKKACTLRYKREICYVILVHASTDDLTFVQDLPPVTSSEYISADEFLDQDGKCFNTSASFIFKKHTYNDWNWEHIVFGFYFSPSFNNGTGMIKILKDSGIISYDAHYPHEYCIRKLQLREYEPWVCPDDI